MELIFLISCLICYSLGYLVKGWEENKGKKSISNTLVGKKLCLDDGVCCTVVKELSQGCVLDAGFGETWVRNKKREILVTWAELVESTNAEQLEEIELMLQRQGYFERLEKNKQILLSSHKELEN